MTTKSVTLHVRITPETKAELECLAQADSRKLADYVRLVLQKHVKSMECLRELATEPQRQEESRQVLKNDEATKHTPCDACGHEIRADRPHWHRATYEKKTHPTINQRNLCERCYPIAEEMLKSADIDWLLDGFELYKPSVR